MSDATPSGTTPVKLSPVEKIKAASDYLRGQIADELLEQDAGFGKDSIQLLKHHGTYQQDDRDIRQPDASAGSKGQSPVDDGPHSDTRRAADGRAIPRRD